MRLKLFLLLALFATLPMLAQRQGVQGTVFDAKSGLPVVGATVILDHQGNAATTDSEGQFIIDDAAPGSDQLLILAYGYNDWSRDITIVNGMVENMGDIQIEPVSFESAQALEFRNAMADMALSESQLEDEEGNTQEIALLSGATDNPFYQASSYTFSTARFRIRGYENQKTETYINSIPFNDAIRFSFNYSMTGGMNQAFRNKTIGMGLEENSYGFGGIGGANNIKTFAADYAPGTRLSLAYTNGNYRWRGMVTHATGLNKHGWAMTVSAVARYADEGVYPGSFYNSVGYFLALQKVFNPQHSLTLTTFGAPTKRAANSAIYEECGRLVGSNMYSPDWGWQEGKKRNSKVVESFDPTAILNWLWKPSDHVSLNTGLAYHKSFYSKAALNWHKAADPRPDYYRYLPSYYDVNTEAFDLYYDRWHSESDYTQIRWDNLYQTNYLNNLEAEETGVEKGSTYILEKRHSNQSSFTLSSVLNMRLSNQLTMQTGANANYTLSSYYKTIKDLLGGLYWLDIDNFSERDFPENPAMAQNDMENPNRKVGKGDRFGYDYDILTLKTQLWHQWVLNMAKWEMFASVKGEYFQFQRDGKMRNGRAPENSYGKGDTHRFLTYGAKAGITFKLDGRNSFTGHAYYGTEAPRPYDAYISSRTKDDVIDLKVEKTFSADLSYAMNFRNFKSIVTVFFTDQRDNTERTAFYDDQYSTFCNFALTGVHKQYKGVEVGLSYKLSPSLTMSAAANIARYQYKNRPIGTRSYENGVQEDVTEMVYLKNFYVAGSPQECYMLAFNWAGPKQWFVELNGAWMNRSYVSISPVRHVEMPTLYTMANSEEHLQQMIKDITQQEKLNEALVINASIGHVIYINRTASFNINLNLNNILDNRSIQTGGYQQGRIDTKDITNTANKFPNKYYYGQGFKMFLNLGLKF
ncbi:MAG: carboxypeptidase-like regulatory domain-containing protein [Muribaculaceae bacterium]|nr:carboxypeptidase-like regulatory domain-containing protein [Muribaculaceae bacterium]